METIYQLKPLTECPKFKKCNAPVCPLEIEWQKRKHVSGDKCCFYLLETAKVNAEANFEGAGLGDAYKVIQVVKREVLNSSGTINRTYERAKETATRLKPKFAEAALA